eukprot:TRINITY_DN55535_c0_g1_i1.p2 TRINITY_DN55535_c0_g1~~TRINITY_DN55535_c0_g1_i1.p2  ORF type:complete len:112 (-),score=8.56 TRINITY_DN55535_c0_g1_i1:100-435(-)
MLCHSLRMSFGMMNQPVEVSIHEISRKGKCVEVWGGEFQYVVQGNYVAVWFRRGEEAQESDFTEEFTCFVRLMPRTSLVCALHMYKLDSYCLVAFVFVCCLAYKTKSSSPF